MFKILVPDNDRGRIAFLEPYGDTSANYFETHEEAKQAVKDDPDIRGEYVILEVFRA